MRDAALKPGWIWVSFGDVVRQVKDAVDPQTSGLERYIAGEHMNTDDLRIRRWGTIDDGYLGPAFHMRFRPGQVLYGSRRTYLRKVAVPDFAGICANTTFVLEAKDPAVLLPELLPFIMQTEAFTEHSIKQSKGSVNPYVNFSDLAWYEFALPPLEEQRRIASVLNSAERTRWEIQSSIDVAKTAENSYLREVFGIYGDQTQKWPLIELHRVAYIQTGAAKGRKPETVKTLYVPYVGVSNVQDGYLDLGEIKKITIDCDRYDRYQLKVGDLLLTEGGDPDKLGRGTVWEGEIEGCAHQNHVFAVRPDTEQVLSWFLAAVTRSVYAKQYFLGCSKRTSNLATINKQQVSSFLVPIPDISTQQNILSEWISIRGALQQLQYRLEKTNSIKASLLSTLVEGVP